MAEATVTELHGKYAKQTLRGNVFMGSTAVAGVAIPISTTLTPTFTLWNQAGSGVVVIPIALIVGWTSVTAALGTIGYSYTANAGNSISSTAPFVAFGSGTAISADLNSGKASRTRFAGGGTTTLVAAATWFRTTGMSITPTTAATASAPGWTWRDDFDGTLVIRDGQAIHVMGSTAIAITATMTLIWEEQTVGSYAAL